MAVGVVDLFEVIQIAQQQAHLAFAPQHPADDLLRVLLQKAPVVEPGERIDQGRFAQGLHQALGLDHRKGLFDVGVGVEEFLRHCGVQRRATRPDGETQLHHAAGVPAGQQGNADMAHALWAAVTAANPGKLERRHPVSGLGRAALAAVAQNVGLAMHAHIAHQRRIDVHHFAFLLIDFVQAVCANAQVLLEHLAQALVHVFECAVFLDHPLIDRHAIDTLDQYIEFVG